MEKTERAYDAAQGRCLDAILSLRRLAGQEAIESLKQAIRIIEAEQSRAMRERRRDMYRIPAAPPMPPPDPSKF